MYMKLLLNAIKDYYLKTMMMITLSTLAPYPMTISRASGLTLLKLQYDPVPPLDCVLCRKMHSVT